MRKLPTGKQTFNDIPFYINPKGCVALRGNPWWFKTEKVPLKITIPIHRKADVLVFLHSGTWVWEGRVNWKYTVHRTDGTQEEIKMVGGDNIRNWANPSPNVPFHREFPTTSKVAWIGSCKTFPKASIYMMTWVDENSDWSDVTEVEFISSDFSVPVLVGITGGVRESRRKKRSNFTARRVRGMRARAVSRSENRKYVDFRFLPLSLTWRRKRNVYAANMGSDDFWGGGATEHRLRDRSPDGRAEGGVDEAWGILHGFSCREHIHQACSSNLPVDPGS